MDKIILNNVKSQCGIELDDDSFDDELVPLINNELLILQQIGLGTEGFEVVTGTETWDDFNPDYPELNGTIASKVGRSVKLIFDPPSSSMATESIRNLIDQATFRISIAVDPGKETTTS